MLYSKCSYTKCFLQALYELETYEPWGRAGGGAPNARGIRFTDIRSKGIYPEDELKVMSIVQI